MSATLADAHVHLFPDRGAGTRWLTGAGIDRPRRDGTAAEYRQLMAQAGIDRCTVLLHARAQTLLPDGVRTVDHDVVLGRVREYNTWGLGAFGGARGVAVVAGVDPGLMSERAVRDEIARCAVAGSAGVKFAPASARLYLDDPRCVVVFEEATRHGLPVVVQSGGAGAVGPRGHPYGRPCHVGPALAAVPGLRVVLAHFGEGYDDEMVELGRAHEGVHADLSMRLNGAPDEARLAGIAHLIRRFGARRVMYGSNYPIANPARSAASLRRLGAHGIDLDVVGAGCWERLFGPAARAGASP